MSLIDIASILILVIFLIISFRRSFISETIDLLAFFIAGTFSIFTFNSLKDYLKTFSNIPFAISSVVLILGLWMLGEFLAVFLFSLLIKKYKILEKLEYPYLSLIPGFIRGATFITVGLIILIIFPVNPEIRTEVDKSFIAKQIKPVTNFVSSLSGFEQEIKFLTINPDTEKAIKLEFTLKEFYPNEELEKEMLTLVNEERKKENLPELIFDEKLREVARRHSGDMFTRGYFAHFSPEGENIGKRAIKAEIPFEIIGENLAYGPSVTKTHKGLMDSKGHRENILSKDFKRVGVGIMDGNSYGIMVTQVFSN